MAGNVARYATGVKPVFAFDAGDGSGASRIRLRMGRPARIHTDKQPHRVHFIPEWAEERHLSRADLEEQIGVNKSTVHRWFSGRLPAEVHLIALAALFEIEISDIFRHPSDDWLARHFKDRSEEERKRMLQMLELAFPNKIA